MSGRTTPECESLFELNDNDSQSEHSTLSQDNLSIRNGTDIDSVSSTVLARCGSVSSRLSSFDEVSDLEPPLHTRWAEPEVDLFQVGIWALQNPGTASPRQGGGIPQELSLEDETIVTSVQRRLREEGPWSLLDPTMVADNRIPITWITRMYEPRLIKHTKMVVQEFLNFDMAGCAGDIEGTWMETRDVHRHVRLACDTLLAIVIALAVFALLTAGTYGMELSFMVAYGLVLLAIGVLVIIRLLLV
ncbi:hypothetical protein MMC11_000942 [Xylographa trunciseda]|nr:hypothetical protein [Xylographa trunciseda]